MNYSYRNYIIFAKNRAKGIEFLENLIGEIKYKDIKSVYKNNYLKEMKVELKDGTTYQVVPATLNVRGYRCNKAYVERSVDKDTLHKVIIPLLCYSKLPLEEQIVYFD